MSGTLAVVQVAYPLARVSHDAVGGAEQIVARLDRALVERGHRSIVIAPEGSRVRGSLVATKLPPAPFDDHARAVAHDGHRAAIASALARERVDVVHLHGVDFHAYVPKTAIPTLVTLHLPPDLYPASALRSHPGVHLHCVSRDQAARCPEGTRLLAPIPNGVDLDVLRPRGRKRRFAIVLGRVCPEKGIDVAIDAARAAGVPLLVGGEVHAYASHVAHFEDVVAPRLGHDARFLGPLPLARKRRLLAAARCLVVASSIAETSSLVAMEALACGTPVVALASGALPEIVEHGVTGILAHDAEGLAEGIARADAIDPRACRLAAERRFSADAMVARYLEVYEALAKGPRAYA